MYRNFVRSNKAIYLNEIDYHKMYTFNVHKWMVH